MEAMRTSPASSSEPAALPNEWSASVAEAARVSRFATYHQFLGWAAAPGYMQTIIDRESARSILEVGGGRTPTLAPDEVRANGIQYTVNDIEAEELALLGSGYETLCVDMAAPLPPEVSGKRYDLIFSRMVNEHVADGAAYYSNIFKLLKPGGLTVHFFATFFTVPALVNRYVPETVSARLQAFAFSRAPRYEKFPARYSWCRGPSGSMFRRFRALGYEVEDYRGYFGHGYYLRIPALHKLEQAKARWLVRHPVNALTSYAMVSLRKPL
jgi:SAM-dependent methyltransferase